MMGPSSFLAGPSSLVTSATRLRLSADERRAAILDAATDVFAIRGYGGASMEEIAREAGIPPALIYEHFDTKRDVHAALVGAYAAELFRRLAAAGGDDPDARLRRGVDAFFGFMEDRHEAWHALCANSADPAVADVMSQVQALAARVIAEMMGAGAGSLTEPDCLEREQSIAVDAQLLSGALQALATWWRDHPEVPREALVDRVVRLAWTG
jgi:AcrR family transcriptional regulator